MADKSMLGALSSWWDDLRTFTHQADAEAERRLFACDRPIWFLPDLRRQKSITPPPQFRMHFSEVHHIKKLSAWHFFPNN